VAKANRDPELVVLLWGENHRDALPERGGISPQIDGNIQYLATQAPHELALTAGMGLKMNSPNGSTADAERLILLDEFDRLHSLGELVLPEYFRKIPPVIFDLFRCDLDRAVDFKRMEFHRKSSTMLPRFG